jgi:hypothetical protein
MSGMAPGRVTTRADHRDAYARWALDGPVPPIHVPPDGAGDARGPGAIMRRWTPTCAARAAPPARRWGCSAEAGGGQVTDGGDVALIGRTLTEDEQVQWRSSPTGG